MSDWGGCFVHGHVFVCVCRFRECLFAWFTMIVTTCSNGNNGVQCETTHGDWLDSTFCQEDLR